MSYHPAPADAPTSASAVLDPVVAEKVNAGLFREAAIFLANRYQRRRVRSDAEQLAYVLSLAGDHKQAVQVLQRMLDYEPTNAVLHERLAEVYERWGRADEAAAARRAAVIFSRAKRIIAANRQPNGWAGRSG